ncbi:MAG TPA: DUF2911 domain-containing protein [Chitinophagaceae bacterium]
MKRSGLICFFFILFFSVSRAQTSEDHVPAVDQSPMDMSYYPDNYPILKVQDKTTIAPVARIIYSRPHLNGRVIVGGLLQYGKLWRMGANEATEIEFFREVSISGKKIPKGRYTLYAIVNPDKWTIILNKETDSWGAFLYDEKKDIVHADVPVQQSSEYAEALSITFEKSTTGCNLALVWDKIKISLPIAFK